MKFLNAKIIGAGIDPVIYHHEEKKRGDKNFVMSRSALCDFASCPARWRNGHDDSGDSDATEWGNLMDALVLDHPRFEKKYAVKPAQYRNKDGEMKDWHGGATICKEWEALQVGKVLIKEEKMREAKSALKALAEDTIISEYIRVSLYQVMATADYHDPRTGLVIPVKVLVDLAPEPSHPEFGKSLGDFKTTRDAAHRKFTSDVFNFRYYVQAALYLDIYSAAMPDEDRCEFRFLVQENVAPFQVGRRLLADDFISAGRATYQRLLDYYCLCLSTDRWPAYDDDPSTQIVPGWSTIKPEAWMIERDL